MRTGLLWGLGALLGCTAILAGAAEDRSKWSRRQWEQEALRVVKSHYKSCGKFLAAKYRPREGQRMLEGSSIHFGGQAAYTFIRKPVPFSVKSHDLSEADRLNGAVWHGQVVYPARTYGISLGESVIWQDGAGFLGPIDLVEEFRVGEGGELELLSERSEVIRERDLGFGDLRVHASGIDNGRGNTFGFNPDWVEFEPPDTWKCDEAYALPKFPK